MSEVQTKTTTRNRQVVWSVGLLGSILLAGGGGTAVHSLVGINEKVLEQLEENSRTLAVNGHRFETIEERLTSIDATLKGSVADGNGLRERVTRLETLVEQLLGRGR
jgi:hypothetical protein